MRIKLVDTFSKVLVRFLLASEETLFQCSKFLLHLVHGVQARCGIGGHSEITSLGRNLDVTRPRGL